MRVLENKRLVFTNTWIRDTEVRLYIQTYPNGRLGLQLTAPMEDAPEHEEPFMTMSVNLPNAPCGANEVYVKEWSENEGATEHLIKWGVIEAEPVGEAVSGYVLVKLYRLTEAFQREVIRQLGNAKRKQRGTSDLIFLLQLIVVVVVAVVLSAAIERLNAKLDLILCTTDTECMEVCLRAGKEDCE